MEEILRFGVLEGWYGSKGPMELDEINLNSVTLTFKCQDVDKCKDYIENHPNFKVGNGHSIRNNVRTSGSSWIDLTLFEGSMWFEEAKKWIT